MHCSVTEDNEEFNVPHREGAHDVGYLCSFPVQVHTVLLKHSQGLISLHSA